MNPNPERSRPPASAGEPSPETLALVRQNVRELLLQSQAFRAMAPEKQREMANQMVQLGAYLVEPEGIKGNTLPAAQPARPAAAAQATDPYAFSLADGGFGDAVGRAIDTPGGGTGSGGTSSADFATNKQTVDAIAKAGHDFKAQSAREGAKVAGLLLQQVKFPDFVAGLIHGVFHAIVQSSIEQMEAYKDLVSSVALTLNQFRDMNTTDNQGRDHLTQMFPDLFAIKVEPGEDGGAPSPKARLREGVDEDAALKKVNAGLPLPGGPISSLDDDTVENSLVPAARTQLATGRQQLLATLVMMGINRVVVTDGKISAKVLYDFQARDSMRFQRSAAAYDYDSSRTTVAATADEESQTTGGETTYSHDDKTSDFDHRDANTYTKGKYQYNAAPVLNAMSAASEQTDAALTTKASLAGIVEVNFKSDYFPLEKMADSFQISRIQNAAQPGRPGAGPAAAGQPAAGASQPAAGGSQTAATPAPPAKA